MRRPPHQHSLPRSRSKGPREGGKRIGLARALSKMGFCSRSNAEELIRGGRVTLNGVLRRDAETPVHLARDRIAVDGRGIESAEKVYRMLNKPRGVVTTASDEKGRETVYHYLRDLPGEAAGWIAPVGRLDKASEGLLLLTNDSEWAGRITAPATHLDKTYHVQIAGAAEDALLAALRRGVESEGQALRASRVEILRRGERNAWLEIVLVEGKNRHIRRMLETLGTQVLRLVRVAIGPLALGDLPKGAARPLTSAEKQWIDQAMSAKRKDNAITPKQSEERGEH
jgi:23S rRNA pseudouridine2605 synthase